MQFSFAVTAKLISAFVFATRIVQYLSFLNPKFQASSHLLLLYSPVVSDLVVHPEDRFSHNKAQAGNSRYNTSIINDSREFKLIVIEYMY